MAPRLGLGSGVTANPASGLFAAAPLLLDSYPNAHRAYSVRKLRTDYEGYAMKVREGSGMNYTNDIAFDDDGRVSLDSKIYNRSDSGTNGVTLGSYLTGYSNPDLMVTTWYDQSGEGSNALQPTTTKQPKLFNGGSLVTAGDPARAGLLFSGSAWSGQQLLVDEAGLSLGSITAFSVLKHSQTSSKAYPWILSQASPYFSHYVNSDADIYAYDADNTTITDPATTDQRMFSYRGLPGAQVMYTDGEASSATGTSVATTALADNAANGMGAWYGVMYFWAGTFQEFIVYDSDQTSNRSDIEANIDAEFEIT